MMDEGGVTDTKLKQLLNKILISPAPATFQTNTITDVEEVVDIRFENETFCLTP